MPLDQGNWTETKSEVFSLEGLIAWLETQNPSEEYCWGSTGECLFARYGEAFSMQRGNDAYRFAIESFHKMPLKEVNNLFLGEPFIPVSTGKPRTFGGALARARIVLASRK